MRCTISLASAIVVVSTAIATEPRVNQTATGKTADAVPRDFQRILARLAERDRATTNDVAKLLVRLQPELAQFMLNRLPKPERQTGAREDVFVGAKLQPPQKAADQIAEIAVRPMHLVAQHLSRHLPTIPFMDRLEAKLERKAELRREVVRNLTLLASPQPQLGKYLKAQLYSSDPNYRMSQLLNESEDLRQARDEMHRFWMNNQPSVLTYERLNGAIGP